MVLNTCMDMVLASQPFHISISNLIRHTPSDVHMPAINFMYVYCVVHTDYLIHHGIDNKRIEWIVCLHCDSMIKIRHWNTKHISILFGNFSFWLLQNWFLWTFKQKMQTIWMSLTLAHSCSLFGFNAISILTKFRGWHLHWFRIYHHSNGIGFIFSSNRQTHSEHFQDLHKTVIICNMWKTFELTYNYLFRVSVICEVKLCGLIF